MEKESFISSIFTKQPQSSTSQSKSLIEEVGVNSVNSHDDKTAIDQDQPTMLELMMAAQSEANKIKNKIAEENQKAATKGFGDGFKKGFFGNASSKPKSNPTKLVTLPSTLPSRDQTKDDVIETIKPKAEVSSSLRLDEVQEAMKSDNPMLNQLKQGEWVTEDLISSFSKNKVLESGFKNPKCVAAIELMQKDPQEAKKRFANDPEVNIFMQEFGRVMSNHFTNIGSGAGPSSSSTNAAVKNVDNNPVQEIQEIGPLHAQVLKQKDIMQASIPSSDVETKQVNEILKDQELRDMLMDVQLQQILQECNDPIKFKVHMSNPNIARKIKKLYEAGLVGTTK